VAEAVIDSKAFMARLNMLVKNSWSARNWKKWRRG